MATNSTPRGIPPISSTLIRPPAATPTSTPPEPAGRDEGQGGEPVGPEGQGGDPGPARPRPGRRTRRDRAQETVRGHKLHLNDALFERLQLLAIQKRTTVSAVASDILEKNLPRLRIERDA